MVLVATRSSHGPGGRRPLAVTGQSQSTGHINVNFGGIELRGRSKFAGRVIVGILVVPVVPSFTAAQKGHHRVFRRVTGGIVGVVAIQVGGTVDQPRKVEDADVADKAADKDGVPEILVPAVAGNLSGKDKTHVETQPRIQTLLKHDHRIFQQITQINLSSSFHNIGMFLDQQPSHVSKKESPGGIVGISICFTVLVMGSVIATPVKNAALVAHGLLEHQTHPQGQTGFVAAVRPKTVNATENSKTRQWPAEPGKQERFRHTVRHVTDDSHQG